MSSFDYNSDNGSNGKSISGLSLAHSRLTKPQRALQGAELLRGAQILVAPTMPQVSFLTGVSPTYLRMAVAIYEDEKLRTLVDQGRLSLADANGRAHQLALPPPHANEIDEVTLIGIARCVGPERMLAAAVAAEAVP
jgi:hypothetical protein